MLEKPQNEGHSKVASLPCNIEFFYNKNHAKADIKDLSLVILSNFSYFYFFIFFAKYFVQGCKLVSLCCVGTEPGLVLSSIIPWSIVQDKSCIFFWQVNFTLNFYLLP